MPENQDNTGALMQELERLDTSIATLKDNNERQNYGARKFQGLYQQQLRADLARAGDRRLEIVSELKERGVEIEPLVSLPKREMPPKLFEVRVIEGGPDGFFALFAGRVGCGHEVECVRSEDAERIAIREHKEKCL